MKISLAVTSCRADSSYSRRLLNSLYLFVEHTKQISPHEYEIVVLYDGMIETWEQDLGFRMFGHDLNKDFATHKNYLNSKCTGDWILQLDADETINNDFLFNIPALVESNPQIEAYWLPRINTVQGLTLAHVRKWNWILTTLPDFTAGEMLNMESEEYRLLKEYNYIISEENAVVTYYRPIIMWPDYQLRLYKNSPDIVWEGKVHEQLTGYKHYTRFPQDVDFAIGHHKDIKRQEIQNSLYETIER
jgi:glycosyltransferase involved in cell wall biosynthesis